MSWLLSSVESIACMAVLLVAAQAELGGSASADEPAPEQESSPRTSKLKRSLVDKTLGGRQFWGDVLFFHGWRIQKHVATDHYRLLDEEDFRHASGTYEQCVARLDQIKAEHELPPMSGKAVIALHGIGRSSKSFIRMAARLRKEGYTVFAVDYPSTRIPIPESADYLNRVIMSLEGIEEISFVVHSMGGLVVRSYLSKYNDPRLHRMVMLGTPNLGAHLADRVSTLAFYKMIYGPAGQQLLSNPEGFIAGLPTPTFEFGILSGARGSINGFNPLIPGDDDGTVNVKSTRLPGAADFVTVRVVHAYLTKHEEVIENVVRFLNTGAFRADGTRDPIPLDPKTEREEAEAAREGADEAAR